MTATGADQPGRFTQLASDGANIFGVFEWYDYDVSINELVRLGYNLGTWSWEIVDTPNWYSGILQAAGGTLFSVNRDSVGELAARLDHRRRQSAHRIGFMVWAIPRARRHGGFISGSAIGGSVSEPNQPDHGNQLPPRTG